MSNSDHVHFLNSAARSLHLVLPVSGFSLTSLHLDKAPPRVTVTHLLCGTQTTLPTSHYRDRQYTCKYCGRDPVYILLRGDEIFTLKNPNNLNLTDPPATLYRLEGSRLVQLPAISFDRWDKGKATKPVPPEVLKSAQATLPKAPPQNRLARSLGVSLEVLPTLPRPEPDPAYPNWTTIPAALAPFFTGEGSPLTPEQALDAERLYRLVSNAADPPFFFAGAEWTHNNLRYMYIYTLNDHEVLNQSGLGL